MEQNPNGVTLNILSAAAKRPLGASHKDPIPERINMLKDLLIKYRQLKHTLYIGNKNLITHLDTNLYYSKEVKNISLLTKQFKSNKEAELFAQRTNSTSLNYFTFFNIDEMKHSELLAFLLNPRSSHGQGNLFLSVFLTELGIDQPELNFWSVTNEKDRIDVLLHRESPHSLVVIENKSNYAHDQPNQLYRYWYHQIYLRNPNLNYETDDYLRHFRILYLTPNKKKVLDYHSLDKPSYLLDEKLPPIVPIKITNWSFDEEIVKIIYNSIKEINPKNYRLKEYLEQYILLIKQL